MKNDEIMVSVCCITYNQAQYIKDALDGFLMQKTHFRYEIIIHDDASTDGTVDIIKEYAEKYPDIIKPIFEKENQYSKGIKRILNINFAVANGKYIALCEGDDYWTDENKLQMQVDYMEENPICTFCFHNAEIIDMEDETKKSFIPYSKELKKYIKKDNIYNVGELELLEFIPTASFMFRRENLSKMPSWFNDCFVGDWPIKLLMTSFGYAYYIDKKMCVYRKNAKGSVTNKNLEKEKESIAGKVEILNKHREFINWIDEFTKGKYKEVFDIRRRRYDLEELIIKRKRKQILKGNYLKGLTIKQKIKYLIKMYCYNIIEFIKRKNGSKYGRKFKK